MRVYIRGMHDRVPPWMVRQAAHAYAAGLMRRLISNYIYLTIVFDSSEPVGSGGVCCMNHEATDFEIILPTKGSKASLLKTLAHEMTHVEQFATGHLRYCYKNSSYRYWKRKRIFIRDPGSDKLPWEVEAYDLEESIYRLYRGTPKETARGVSAR